MKKLTSLLALSLLFGCGGEEPAAPPAEPDLEEPPAEPEPEPEPPPPPVVECPEDGWAVGTRSDYQIVADGRAAADRVRDLARGSWERISVCRTTDDGEFHMICGPNESGTGADCSIGLPDQRCSTSNMPRPVLPVAAGDFVDNSEPPGNAEWRCAS